MHAAESCADDQLIYVAVHCHGGIDRVEFSDIDMASHERGYPALLDITQRPAVGALVFARNAVAGDLWLADGTRVTIDRLQVVGRPQLQLHPEPRRPAHAGEAYDRQSRIFGDRGQAILATQRVAIIGLGGAGSLVNEYVARLGVGEILLIDPDRIEISNLSRVVGARRRDARSLLTAENRPEWVRRIGRGLAEPKVKIAARVAREASRTVTVTTVVDDVLEPEVAEMLKDCDHIFLAADAHSARRLVDVLTHQYFIPTTQVGAKVSLVEEGGEIADIFSAVRASVPGDGCLRCAQLISPVLLQEEAKSQGERRRQRYLDDADVPSPSVITLNAVAAAHAVNDWMMSVTGLTSDLVTPDRWMTIHPLIDETVEYSQRIDPRCPNCGPARFARGDARRLPTKVR
ncbi:ThiF family adenylyltransferase [Microbacterium rhizomatis]|uniref:ThiF family adenylyltransferase n=1 Tax=Microbacterium rhizomatis TaxID=1631477 RepID=UPI0014781F77|nr:ThiF family adenylyltransferase [Microbacterium rhizomatis]